MSRTNLLDPPWYMKVAMEKGTQNCVGLIFGAVHKSVWCTSRHGILNDMVHKLAWVGNKLSSPVSRRVYQATLGRAM